MGRDLHPRLPLCCKLKRRWWHHQHTAAGGEGLAPTSATLLHVDPPLAAPALAAPALAAPALAALALAATALAAPSLAAPALWAEEELSAIGLYGCTNQITTIKRLVDDGPRGISLYPTGLLYTLW